ncbi:pentapeptide repeat-containing protein [Leptolyngbya sp. FACHB-17]|uniref:pentapeptide repeat-containing protein n=1 Tax=Leptolyngbya sp. FACHB-17 TaxID=2692803 RepID=UPI0016811EA1|nr:pentapeptide repeat-containing protein [Leptolyngbya sp. FACHB-17]MBD2079732.1 pentapeptide repeat-containing protein [Leptolyngbya sp. FACHB-17]
MEVLTSFIQEKSPLPDYAKPTEQQTTDSDKPTTSGITKDVQAALTVISRRDIRNDPEGALQRIDLSRTDLSGADLSEANLSKAKLYFACLYKANFTGANLSKAQLNATELSGG